MVEPLVEMACPEKIAISRKGKTVKEGMTDKNNLSG